MKGDQPKIHFVPKGWGFEKWIVNKPEYCGKLLYIVKDKRCSLHYHKLKDEVFYVQSGLLKIYYSDDPRMENIAKWKESFGDYKNFCETAILKPGDNFHVPPGRYHQLVGLQDTELFEFSTEHKDTDSYRLVAGD